ncbi:MAG: DEAD/DEAH box helicase [Anaerolineae bacterium]|nr:DEAD/DEAH box helicase [Anaerolineae bacterium]
MRGELVAIDLETTGLDPLHDSIIEIGAVRFKDGQVVDELSQLIDPGFPIPATITHITGITTEHITGQPSIDRVLPVVKQFVGDAPVIGHTINFDAAFMAQQGALKTNPLIDTYDLAAVLLPRTPRYNLTSLTAEVGISLENAHRALDDARATGLLYWQLWQRALKLPYATLQEIVNAAQGLNWQAEPVFRAALAEMTPPAASRPVDLSGKDLFGPPPQDEKPLRPNDQIDELDADEVAAFIDDDGALSDSIPGYEKRPQQIAMARAVTRAFNKGDHIFIEAGTGTGKSIAYLVPAAQWATTNNQRVVVSTNTINLQEQLINKDLPLLQKAMKTPFRASVLKGRSNYLCPRRLAAIRRRRPTSIDELRTLAKILVWLLESPTGDRGEISLRGPVENITWQRLSAEDEGCQLDRCRAVMEGTCPFYKARKAAEAAHLLIVNHALLLSDAASDNRVLPEYTSLILDEGHHLEDAVTSGFSFRLDEATLRRRLTELGGPTQGLLGEVLRSAAAAAPDKDVKKLRKGVSAISDATKLMEHHIGSLFTGVQQVVDSLDSSPSTDYVTQVRIIPSVRERDAFAQLQERWFTLKEFFDVISQAMQQLTEALARMEPYNLPDYNDLVNSTATSARYLKETHQQLNSFVAEPDPNMIYWINTSRDRFNAISIHAAPLHIGPMVENYLWNAKETIVVTSATLQTRGSFDYIRERLNAQHVETLEVGSPFNYRESTLLYIPTDIPEPNDRHQYQQAVERGIVELAAALDGRVLALFTSYAQLRQTAQAITPRLSLGGIAVYDQSDGSSRQALLDGFMSTGKAVLLGTRSFWEGIDIPGQDLSALVIVRLPFSVPSDPIFSARSETYSNSFNDYAIPDAILRFRQGFGRLIRTSTDRGVVTVFDRRIISKGYGIHFLEALPDCTVQHGPLEMLSSAAKNWLSLTQK